jgi:hypothetical protein
LLRAIEDGLPFHLLHTFPQAPWSRSTPWRSLGQLVLKTDGGQPQAVEVGGQDRERAALAETLQLEPLQRTETSAEYYTLLYLHAPRLPDNTLGIHSPVLGRTVLLKPTDWANIWVYGQQIFMVGWLSKGEFRKKSRRLPAGAAVRQYTRTQTENGAVPVTALRPLRELVDLLRS